ncbi:lysozyme inhibitor LprI family protein [Pseudomonas serboccidentalis]|uniref:Lysozyme inhibitor LprI family protein n=1 Tax=Pseudomonas serboccidentalis TaxID=2964670 RepID=A0ABY7Z887_9PSED|nr:lysozyme inhibitor LprI family protein [Pseudomonas serboccidentalis]WDR35237.1 lysozyme inhibitor LprI family protein [Pseudomonas serboccidentalis]
MYIKGRYIVSACALLFIQQAMAAGMDCAKASSAVENTICANKGLYDLDAQMGMLYRQLMTTSAQAQPDLKQTQRSWLKTRNECVEDVACLDLRYRERLQLLQTQWTQFAAHQPDGVDKQVLDDLQNSIRAASKTDPQFALERTLASLSLKSPGTTFSADPDADQFSDKTHFPKTRPKGVSQDEWKALSTTEFDADTALGRTMFTLIDLDGDRQRDLIVETYTGGTGLYTFVETFRREGDKFNRRTPASDGESIGGSLYSTNDRGANQSVNWVNIGGKVYAAYRAGAYGVDRVYLLNPLQINHEVPIIEVRYDYRLSVPRTQHNEDGKTTFKLEPALHQSLNQALTHVTESQTQASEQRTPICPIPPTATDTEGYYSYGAGYYAIESVADFPVIIGKECFIGRMNNWFGAYSEKDGLFAQMTVRKPDPEDGGRTYEVKGRRQLSGVSTSIGKFEENGDN